MSFIKVCRKLVSNRGPLSSEATALPTEPQPLPQTFLKRDTKDAYVDGCNSSSKRGFQLKQARLFSQTQCHQKIKFAEKSRKVLT